MLKEIARRGNAQQQEWAWQTLTLSEQMRGQRQALSVIAAMGITATGTKRRTVYDARNRSALPGRLVRGEGDPKSKDRAVNEAYDGAGATYDLYLKVFGRNSIDERGMRLDSTSTMVAIMITPFGTASRWSRETATANSSIDSPLRLM